MCTTVRALLPLGDVFILRHDLSLLVCAAMTAVSDSAIFRNIFATTESNEIWSDTKRTKFFLRFEACLAEAQAELGIVCANSVRRGLFLTKWKRYLKRLRI